LKQNRSYLPYIVAKRLKTDYSARAFYAQPTKNKFISAWVATPKPYKNGGELRQTGAWLNIVTKAAELTIHTTCGVGRCGGHKL
jgi:hypothetical protein